MADHSFNVDVNVDVLAFDVFGTVVDWHGSICREVTELGLDVEPADFVRAWRDGYQPAMQRVRSGELGWTRIDDLHRMILDEVLASFGISLSEADCKHLNTAWHRLEPWPDVLSGLNRLKPHYQLCTLSNGNLLLLSNMAKRAQLPWDLILSAEVFRAYKPDPETYLGVASTFDVAPDRVMLVAAHQSDLDAARACGLKTAYVERAEEYGRDAIKDVSGDENNDLHVRHFGELADRLAPK